MPTVTGKRGPGKMRVEWEFTPMTPMSCERVVRIFGSEGSCYVETAAVEIPMEASAAAVEIMDARPDDMRTVKS